MATLNSIQCGDSAKNTGICDCFLDPKLIVGAILIPKSRVLTQAEINDIQATLEAGTLAAKVNRFFPVQNFVAVTDSTEDPTNQTFGYGSIEPVREGNYNLTFQFRQGGVQLSNNLRSFNGLTAKYAVLFIESSNILIGTSKKDANGDDGLAGIPMEVIYTFPWKVNDGTNLSQYRIQFVFKPSYVNENISFAKIDTSEYLLTELAGLETIKLTVVEVDDDTATVTGKTDCGADAYELFSEELEEETAWVLKDADGELMTVLTASKNDAAGGWDITASATIPDGATIELAAPSVLAEAPINIVGYDSEAAEIVLGSS